MPQLGVIFDMDGVLVDSYQAHFASWLRLYDELGLPYSEADFAGDFGRTSRDILRGRFGEDFSLDEIRKLDERKEALFREELEDDFPTMDGAVELIDCLAANGILMAVGSSGPPENIALCLEKLGRREKFAAIVTGADVSQGKPDPEVFELAASRLGVPADWCVVIEDAVHGVDAANRAGMLSIGITGTVERGRLSSAELVVDSLRELSAHRICDLIQHRHN